MKSKTALVLVVVLVGCLAFLLVRNTDWLRPSKPTEPPAASKKVFEKTPLGIVRIILSPASGAKLVLAKEGADWRVEEPYRARADAYKVNTLVDAVSQLKTARSFAPGDNDAVDPKITSVDAPLWTVELTGAGGDVWKLAVGKPLPLRTGETYVQPQQQPAAEGKAPPPTRTFVALADLAATLQGPARDYRDKTVVRFNTSQAVGLSLAGREVRDAYELHKIKGEWGIVKPFSARADQDAVRDILGALSFLSVESFVADAPAGLAGYGLEEGKERLVARVSVRTEPNAPRPAAATTSSMPAAETAPASQPAPKIYAVAFGERTNDKGSEKVYARIVGEPAVFQMNASVLDNLLKKMEGLRRNTVLEFDPEVVSAVEMRLPTGPVSLQKEDGRWKMTQPLAGKANGAAVADLLGKLAGLKAQAWAAPGSVPSSATGLEKPYATVTLSLAGKGETVGLLIGSSMAPDQTYVKSATGTSIALVKTADSVPLLASGATYWNPVLYQLPFDVEATKLVLARRDDTFTLVRGDDKWKLTTPIAAPADQAHVEKLLRDLANVSAEKIVYLGADVPENYTKAAFNLTLDVYGRKPTTQPASSPTSASAPATGPAGNDSIPDANAEHISYSYQVPGTSSAPASLPAGVRLVRDGSGPALFESASQPATAASQPTSRPATGPARGPEEPLVKLQVVKVGPKAYAWRLPVGGSPSGPGEKTPAVGEFPAFFYDDLAAELRDRTIWKIEPNDVLAVKLLAGEDRLELRREGEEWVSALNPDEKADAEGVRAYLAGLKDLAAERFMTYKAGPADAEKLGLAKPWATLELRLAGGKTLNLLVSARGQDLSFNRYASASCAEGIFVLPADVVAKLAKKFSDLKKSPPRPVDGVQ